VADTVSAEQVGSFLQELGRRYPKPAVLYLLGGSALALLGDSRPTLDIDYVGSDIRGRWDELQRLIDEVATEMDLKIDAVPYEEMIPLPPGWAQRHIHVGDYGEIHVYVFDPYAIALGKLDRGFPTDLEDVVFLIEHNFVILSQLEEFVQAAIPDANEYDLNPRQEHESLAALRQMLKR
jgi:Nucleotidyltransferase of unknown function (DUF6036)